MQALKRRRTETFASPGVVKPEKPVPKQQPTLADLLHLYRDPRSGAQGRPGSLRRPSMPLFESLRRPPPGVRAFPHLSLSSPHVTTAMRHA